MIITATPVVEAALELSRISSSSTPTGSCVGTYKRILASISSRNRPDSFELKYSGVMILIFT